MMVERMDDWFALTEASKESGYSTAWLRYLGDTGQIPMLVDPVGRRLFRKDVILKLASTRGRSRKDNDTHSRERAKRQSGRNTKQTSKA